MPKESEPPLALLSSWLLHLVLSGFGKVVGKDAQIDCQVAITRYPTSFLTKALPPFNDPFLLDS